MRLRSGEAVVDRHHSHLHEGVLRYLPAAFSRIDTKGRQFLVEEVDFGQPIGETICVTTGPGDQILFARRPGRHGLSRFVLDRTPEPCSSVVVILKWAGDLDAYILITAFVGHKAEPEPWDRNATRESRDFWANHAMVWGAEETVPGTETPECPW